jgi:hypothetical protein
MNTSDTAFSNPKRLANGRTNVEAMVLMYVFINVGELPFITVFIWSGTKHT